MRFVGVDLTSAFGASPRAIDIAVLDDELRCTLVKARWPAQDLVTARDACALTQMIASVLPPSTDEDVWAIDGPQALARRGQPMRACERALGTPGRTPDSLPLTTSKTPFATYIRSSVDLFAALLSASPTRRLGGRAGVEMTAATLFEIFPGAEWVVFAGQRLPGKEGTKGRALRRALFEHLGVTNLPALPTPDENDALIGAYLAWCTRHRSKAVTLEGAPAAFESGGEIREGAILHATGEARARYFVVAADALVESATARPSESTERAADEWSGGDALLLRLNDAGGVHGKHPENAWLVPGQNYELETMAPFPTVHVTLSYAKDVSGGRSWTVKPTVRALLKTLGEDLHPSNENSLSLPVRVV